MPRIGVTHGESRKDASSNVTTVGTGNSSLRQPGLAKPINTVLGILGVLVDDKKTFPALNCETGVDSQHLRSLFPRLLKLSQLRIGGREPKMGPLEIGQARCAFA